MLRVGLWQSYIAMDAWKSTLYKNSTHSSLSHPFERTPTVICVNGHKLEFMLTNSVLSSYNNWPIFKDSEDMATKGIENWPFLTPSVISHLLA